MSECLDRFARNGIVERMLKHRFDKPRTDLITRQQILEFDIWNSLFSKAELELLMRPFLPPTADVPSNLPAVPFPALTRALQLPKAS